MNTKRTPEQKAEQRQAARSSGTSRRLRSNPYSGALSMACEQCEVAYKKLPAPRNLAEFNLVTSPTALTTYQDRQRRDNVPNSYEVVTEDDGRGDASGSRQEWVVRA